MKQGFALKACILVFMMCGAFAQAHTMECIPANSQKYPLTGFISSGLSEEEYDFVLDLIQEFYEEEFSLYGARLNIVRDWKSPEANAYADRSSKDVWEIIMAGGLARHPSMTMDSFALVACHELGHHIGGAPKRRYYSSWASNEGQADYFATLKCLRRVFRDDNNLEAIKRLEVPNEIRTICAAQFEELNDAAICIRSIQAGMDLMETFADLSMRDMGVSQSIEFLKLNGKTVKSTMDYHPRLQCRFDTYRAGAFCPVSHEGRVSQRDVFTGTCQSGQSDKHKIAVRPNCWFAAN